MWLYLLQPVNTDFINLVFEHNTLVHTELNDEIPQGAANAFALSVEQETVGGATYGPTPLEPGNITVRNNAFVVLGGSGMFNGALPDADHYNNLYAGVNFPNNWTQHATEIVVGGAEAGIGSDGRPAAGSVVIDAASAEFVVTDHIDFDGNAVPLGSAPDIGAFEYCEGADCQEPATGAGGVPTTGGADPVGGTDSTGGLTETAPPAAESPSDAADDTGCARSTPSTRCSATGWLVGILLGLGALGRWRRRWELPGEPADARLRTPAARAVSLSGSVVSNGTLL